MKDLILNNNFDDIDFIIENDALYLDVKTIALLGDSNEETVRRNCNEVYKEYVENADFSTNMWKSLYIEKKTGGRPRKLYIHYIAGDVLHRLKSPRAIKFRIWANEKTFRTPEQPKSIEPSRKDKILLKAKKQQAKIKTVTDALYVELNFRNPSHKRAKEILKRLEELKPEELRLKRQIQNIENCFGSLNRETSARSQSRLLDFDNKSKRRLL